MTVERNRIGRDFWPAWVLVSIGGWIVGFFFGFVLADVLGDIIAGGLGDILGIIMWGAGLGSVVSGMQWLVLRGQVSRAGWWVLASTAGFALAFGVGSEMMGSLGSVAELLDWTVVVTLGGAVTGTLQWLVLRGQVSRPGWWVLASTVGWGLSMAVAGTFGLEDGAEIFYGGSLFGGLVLGAVTGGVLVWMLRQPVPEA